MEAGWSWRRGFSGCRSIWGRLLTSTHSAVAPARRSRIYRDVVVQVADDADFINGVKTIFNNDQDNSAGLGVARIESFLRLTKAS